jgi:hypothetical protein
MRAVVCVRIVAPIEYARVGLGRSCERSRSQLTPPLVVMSSCGVRSGHRWQQYCSRVSCERANEQREVYSPVGGWLQLPLASRVQLQGLPLLTLMMLKVLQEPVCLCWCVRKRLELAMCINPQQIGVYSISDSSGVMQPLHEFPNRTKV